MPRSRSFRSNRHVCGGVAPNVAGTTSIFAIVSLVLVTGGSSVKAATCADLLINVTSDKACTACLTGRDSLNCVYCALPGEETCTSDQERRTCALQYTVNEQQVENPDSTCINMDKGAVDRLGKTCADYAGMNEYLCNGRDKDNDFDPAAMCCVCGGGKRGTCYDGDFLDQLDSRNQTCASYTEQTAGEMCGKYDDEDFDSMSLCCACSMEGGYTIESTCPARPVEEPCRVEDGCDVCNKYDSCGECVADPDCNFCATSGFELCGSASRDDDWCPDSDASSNDGLITGSTPQKCSSISKTAGAPDLNDPALVLQKSYLNAINAGPVWTKGYTGEGILVNIITDALDYVLDEFEGKFVHHGNNYDPGPVQLSDSQGTKMAGFLAARADNGVCGAGVAYGASIMASGWTKRPEGKDKGSFVRESLTEMLSSDWSTDFGFGSGVDIVLSGDRFDSCKRKPSVTNANERRVLDTCEDDAQALADYLAADPNAPQLSCAQFVEMGPDICDDDDFRVPFCCGTCATQVGRRSPSPTPTAPSPSPSSSPSQSPSPSPSTSFSFWNTTICPFDPAADKSPCRAESACSGVNFWHSAGSLDWNCADSETQGKEGPNGDPVTCAYIHNSLTISADTSKLCGGDYDDNDFVAAQMCCACGGGTRSDDGKCYEEVADYCAVEANHDDACTSFWEFYLTCDHNSLSSLDNHALKSGVKDGRQGKGIIYVSAAGDSYRLGNNVNFEGHLGSIFTMAIGATAGTSNAHAPYSNAGTAVHACAPGGSDEHPMWTTTLSGDNCANGGSSTSYATSIAAGVVAMMLQANPDLSWRDVQHIIAHTSTRVHPDDESWVENDSGMKHSTLYGFGLLNALAAVEMAENWGESSAQAVKAIEWRGYGVIPDSNCGDWLDDSVGTCADAKILGSCNDEYYQEVCPATCGTAPAYCKNAGQGPSLDVKIGVIDVAHISSIEHIVLYITLRSEFKEQGRSYPSNYRGNLDLVLVSPCGTRSQILWAVPESTEGEDGFTLFKVMTLQFWGEESIEGYWTVELRDKMNPSKRLNIRGLLLSIYGKCNSGGRGTCRAFTKANPGPFSGLEDDTGILDQVEYEHGKYYDSAAGTGDGGTDSSSEDGRKVCKKTGSKPEYVSERPELKGGVDYVEEESSSSPLIPYWVWPILIFFAMWLVLYLVYLIIALSGCDESVVIIDDRHHPHLKSLHDEVDKSFNDLERNRVGSDAANTLMGNRVMELRQLK